MYNYNAYNTTLIKSNSKICTTCFINRVEKLIKIFNFYDLEPNITPLNAVLTGNK